MLHVWLLIESLCHQPSLMSSAMKLSWGLMSFHLCHPLILQHKIGLAVLYVYMPPSFLLTLYHGKLQTWIKVERRVKQSPSSHHQLPSQQIPSLPRLLRFYTQPRPRLWLFWSKSLDVTSVTSFHLLFLTGKKKKFFLKKKDRFKMWSPQHHLCSYVEIEGERVFI